MKNCSIFQSKSPSFFKPEWDLDRFLGWNSWYVYIYIYITHQITIIPKILDLFHFLIPSGILAPFSSFLGLSSVGSRPSDSLRASRSAVGSSAAIAAAGASRDGRGALWRRKSQSWADFLGLDGWKYEHLGENLGKWWKTDGRIKMNYGKLWFHQRQQDLDGHSWAIDQHKLWFHQ